MKDFFEIPEERKLYKGEYFFIVKDLFPVSPGHLLIISNRLKTDYFSLNETEKRDLNSTIEIAKSIIEKEYNPDGYNIGMNCGEAAGQTVFHFHCHLIPRYIGDMENPRGGVRHCVYGKGYYN
ncbi:MAG: HIT family protein [Chitinophagaceae bacterium]|nr:HIT family protein [Chitinophagaceae bacterium]